ncbi:MAG: transcriptional repressor, partial [Clostridia bacterium]|nr:transcriptional repressor [Clostridia bacterium]
MKRFSKKRQSIIDLIKRTDVHPSAEWIYNELKPVYPDLSLATVYRNLKELEESGEIVVVDTVKNKERFDGKTFPHTHAVCSKCGKIIDVFGTEIPDDVILRAQERTDFVFSGAKL